MFLLIFKIFFLKIYIIYLINIEEIWNDYIKKWNGDYILNEMFLIVLVSFILSNFVFICIEYK